MLLGTDTVLIAVKTGRNGLWEWLSFLRPTSNSPITTTANIASTTIAIAMLKRWDSSAKRP
jgi:hypothetical protein